MKVIETKTAVNVEAPAGFKIKGLRWWISGLIFFATLINYIDRLTISALAPVIKADLGLSNAQYGGIATWFLVAYTISQAASGKLFDRVGIKSGFTISIIVWSLAAMAHAFARGLTSLSVFRFILGLGEAGNWPGAAKTVAEWFPVQQRAFAMAIFNSGAAIGSIVAIPLIIALNANFGWQATFLITGALGFVWLAAWLVFYESPAKHRWLTEKERRVIEAGQPNDRNSDEPAPAYFSLLGHRQTWAIIAARFFVDPVWWLYIVWLPSYLADVRGFDLRQIGLFAWVPFVLADAGSLFGGWLAGFLIKRGWSVDRARKAVIAFAALLMPAGIGAAFATDPMVALGLIGIVLFGFQVWINNVQTLPSDFFSTKAVGSVAGLGGMGAGVGSIIFTLSTGFIVDRFSYTPVLIAAGILAPIGTIVLFLLAGKIERVKTA